MKTLKSILEGIFNDNISTKLDINEVVKSHIKEKIKDCEKKHLPVYIFDPVEQGYTPDTLICSVRLETIGYDNQYKLNDPNVTENLKIAFAIEYTKNKKGISIHPDRGVGGINEAFSLHMFGKNKSWGTKKEITGIIFDDITVYPNSTAKQINDFLKIIDSIFEGYEKCCKIDNICNWNWRLLKSKENVLMLLDRLKEILPNPIVKLIKLNPRYTRMQ